MTAAEELRHMLDERGVKWTSERVSDGVLFTFAKDGRTYSVFVRDRAGLEIWSQYLTPEQAIEATLGRGECSYEIAAFGDGKAWYQCSECGGMASADYDPPKYCPHCGAKVVSE